MANEVTVLHRNIQSLCKKKGITVADMETNAGVPSGSASNWRIERRWMKHLPAIAKELGVTIDQLFRPNYEKIANDDVRTPHIKIMNALEAHEIDDKTALLIIKMVELILEDRHK